MSTLPTPHQMTINVYFGNSVDIEKLAKNLQINEIPSELKSKKKLNNSPFLNSLVEIGLADRAIGSRFLELSFWKRTPSSVRIWSDKATFLNCLNWQNVSKLLFELNQYTSITVGNFEETIVTYKYPNSLPSEQIVARFQEVPGFSMRPSHTIIFKYQRTNFKIFSNYILQTSPNQETAAADFQVFQTELAKI